MDLEKAIEEYSESDIMRYAILKAWLNAGGVEYFERMAIAQPKTFASLVGKCVKSDPTTAVQVNANGDGQVQVYMPDNGRGGASPAPSPAAPDPAAPTVEIAGQSFDPGIPSFLGEHAAPVPKTLWDVDKDGSEAL